MGWCLRYVAGSEIEEPMLTFRFVKRVGISVVSIAVLPPTHRAPQLIHTYPHQVNQRVSFIDPQSGIYTDGVVIGIHGPKKIEVGYWRSSWSDPR